MSSVRYYKNKEGLKCVDLDVEKSQRVDIKGWSRIFQHSNRDLVIKDNERLRLRDVITNNVVAEYDEELNRKLNNKPVIRKKAS
jgi:hypothetical protein